MKVTRIDFLLFEISFTGWDNDLLRSHISKRLDGASIPHSERREAMFEDAIGQRLL
jgi:hypothetical protein